MKKHKTYAETQGKETFDWNKFLRKKKFTDPEIRIIARELRKKKV